MPIFRLRDGVIFDASDGDGLILDSEVGEFLTLNQVATLILETCLQCDEEDAAVASLEERIDASSEQLREGLASLAQQLGERGLLANGT